MFDSKFIKILIDYNNYVSYISRHRANYGLMESKLRYNYTHIKKNLTEIDDIFDNCSIFVNNNLDFIKYYDDWFSTFNQK
jgi:hypothetical protein